MSRGRGPLWGTWSPAIRVGFPRRGRGDVPVLDSPMLQLQLGRRGTSRAGVFYPHPAQVLLNRLLAEGHPVRDRLERHSGRIELQRPGLLRAESRPVGSVIGGDYVG